MKNTLNEGAKIIIVEIKEIIEKHEWGIHMVIIYWFSMWNNNSFL